MGRLAWWKQFYSHRYFKRIFYLSISTLIALVLLVTSTFYFYIGDSVTRNKYETDMQTLLQIERNFHFINQLLVNYSKKIFEDPATAEIMRGEPGGLDWERIESNLMILSSNMVSYAPYIHSIYVYNSLERTYYAAYPKANAAPIDIYLATTINKYNTVPKLSPVLRKIRSNEPGTVRFDDVLSYFCYDEVDEKGHYKNAVILNVEPSWLLDNLYSLNTGLDDWFLLMTLDREFISYSENIPFNYLNDVKDIYYGTVIENIQKGVMSDMIPCDLRSERFILSYIYMPEEGFILYKLESYDSVYSEVNRVKNMVLIVSFSIIIISLFLSIFMAKRIYTPFYALVKAIRQPSDNGRPGQRQFDELGFLQDSYVNSANEIILLRNEVSAADGIKYKYYLSRFLIGDDSVNAGDIREICNSEMLQVDLAKPLILVILKLGATPGGVSAFHGIIGWMAATFNDCLDGCPPHDIIDLENNSVVAIINSEESNDNGTEKDCILSAIEEMRQHTWQNYGLTFSAVISSNVTEFSKVSEAYLKLQQYLLYSYTFGPEVTITTELISDIVENTALNYPADDEKKLITAINEKNYDAVDVCLDKIISAFKKMNYNNMMISLVNLCNAVRKSLNEFNRANLKAEYIDMFDLSPMEYNCIDELRSFLLDLVKSSFATDITLTKHSKLITATKDLIERKHADPNTNLISIAEEIKISPNYLNYTFKNSCGISVSEYIMDYRLGKASELMRIANMNVASIMSQVGIENESTFYRRFKAKFGVTPKNYITALHLLQYPDSGGGDN